ncbi:MAG: M20/M25/M40 family metallo-hydrolase [Candidatus Aminicenantaceae bacterium]
MRKPVFAILLTLALVFMVGAQAPQRKAEDVEKNLVLVDKPQAAPEEMRIGLETITEDSALGMLSFLSSDLLEGRDTATRGYMLAAEYVASLFKVWGIEPAGDTPAPSFRFMRSGPPPAPPKRTYFQEIVFRETSNAAGSLTLNVRKGAQEKSNTYVSGIDFSMTTSAAEILTAPVVFAGYGIREDAAKWDDFKNLDVKGKIVLILTEAPGRDDPESPFQKNKELKDKYFPQAPAMRMMRRGGGGGGKTADIRKLGAAAILQVQNTGTDDAIFKGLASTRSPSDERPINTSPRRRLSIPGLGGMMSGGGAPIITISREIANAILENSGKTIDELKKSIETSRKPASMELSGTKLTIESTATVKLVKCLNVLGMIEGSDPELKKEVVVIGGHMDHLGQFDNYIYNGADDNGSGSVGVMTAARAFAANPVKPKRSVLFALWTGEEKGLYGSRYYVEHPVFPMDKTAMYFNMDMISRAYDESTFTRMSRMFQFPGGEDLLKKINLADFLTVSFTTGMDDLVREANQYVGLHVFLRESEPGQASGGSDHAAFAPKDVPFVYSMAAMTSDYHQTGDSVDKVAGELFAKACRLTYLVSFAAANK